MALLVWQLAEEPEGEGSGAVEELVWVQELELVWALRWDKEFCLEQALTLVAEFGLEMAAEV